MKKVFADVFLVTLMTMALIAGMSSLAAAHCDTLDGPVVQDARKALEVKDITPVLKWVKPRDERAVRKAYARALSAKGRKNRAAAENQFFATVVRIHRAGEGAPFTGLKPAGEIEPVILEADKSLENGSSDALINLVTSDVASGIRNRFERVSAAYKQKDENVEKGREFVEAYVEYTHYVERIHLDAKGGSAHAEHAKPSKLISEHGQDAHHRHGH